jgi:hypothetical protein
MWLLMKAMKCCEQACRRSSPGAFPGDLLPGCGAARLSNVKLSSFIFCASVCHVVDVAAAHCLCFAQPFWLHLLQVCGSDAEAAAALEAWSMFGPQHPDPAAEYARLKPPPPKVNTLDRYFRKAAPAASPAAAPADQQPRSSGQGRIQQQDGQQQQQQQQQPATVTGGVGASSSNALQVLMSAARQQQPQPGAGSASAGAGSASAAAAAVSPAAAAAAGGAGAGGGRKLKRHTFESCSGWAGMLAAIARNPER